MPNYVAVRAWLPVLRTKWPSFATICAIKVTSESYKSQKRSFTLHLGAYLRFAEITQHVVRHTDSMNFLARRHTSTADAYNVQRTRGSFSGPATWNSLSRSANLLSVSDNADLRKQLKS